MSRSEFLLVLMAMTPGAFGFEETPRAPVAANSTVELTGVIERVQVVSGQGMPYLEIRAGGKLTRVFLGSIRYLMEQNFNPKAGAAVKVKGYKVEPDVVAISVTLTAEGRTLRLRDEHGWPLWRGGRRMRPAN